MAAQEIGSIFQEVMKKNLSYCALCFRAEDERKLVTTDAMVEMQILTNIGIPFSKAVCFACSAYLKRAVRTIQAVLFGALMEQWFRMFSTKMKYASNIPAHIESITQGMKFGSGVSLDVFWSSLQTRMEMGQTEVLLIDTTGVVQTPDRDLIQVKMPVPDIPPRDAELDNAVEKEKEDKRPILVPFSQLLREPTKANTVALIPNEMQIMARDRSDPRHFIIHPLAATKKNELYVPNMKMKIQQNRLVECEETDYELAEEISDYGRIMEINSIIEKYNDESVERDEGLKKIPDYEERVPQDIILFHTSVRSSSKRNKEDGRSESSTAKRRK